MYEEYIEELEDKIEELEDRNLGANAWKNFYSDENIKLRKSNEKLQNNWNELKKWLEEEKGQWGKDNRCWYESVLDKMQELEQGKDE